MASTYRIPTTKEVAKALRLKEPSDSFGSRNPTIYHKGLRIDVKYTGYRYHKQAYINIETGGYPATRRRVVVFKAKGLGLSFDVDTVKSRDLTPEEKKQLKAKVKEMAAVQVNIEQGYKDAEKTRRDKRNRQEVVEKALKKAKIDIYGYNPDIDIYKERVSVSFRGKSPDEIVALVRKIQEIVGEEDE